MSPVGHTHELQLGLSVIDLLLGKKKKKNLLSEDWPGHGVSKWAVCPRIIVSPLVQVCGCCRSLGTLQKRCLGSKGDTQGPGLMRDVGEPPCPSLLLHDQVPLPEGWAWLRDRHRLLSLCGRAPTYRLYLRSKLSLLLTLFCFLDLSPSLRRKLNSIIFHKA